MHVGSYLEFRPGIFRAFCGSSRAVGRLPLFVPFPFVLVFSNVGGDELAFELDMFDSSSQGVEQGGDVGKLLYVGELL